MLFINTTIVYFSFAFNYLSIVSSHLVLLRPFVKYLWLIDWLIDWLFDSLIDWLAEMIIITYSISFYKTYVSHCFRGEVRDAVQDADVRGARDVTFSKVKSTFVLVQKSHWRWVCSDFAIFISICVLCNITCNHINWNEFGYAIL